MITVDVFKYWESEWSKQFLMTSRTSDHFSVEQKYFLYWYQTFVKGLFEKVSIRILVTTCHQGVATEIVKSYPTDTA